MSKVILGMATIRSRENSLKVTLLSLTKQCDTIFVYLNDYTSIPQWLSSNIFPNVVPILGTTALGDLGDAAKFYAVKDFSEGIFISVDDDIIYADDFVKTMVRWSNEYEGEVLCTTHGRRLGDTQVPIQGYFKDAHKNTRLFHGFGDVTHPEFVHFGGTGSMCFNLSKKRPPHDIFGKQRNIADIWVGIHAQETRTPILVVPHSRTWLQSTDLVNIEDTIWSIAQQTDEPKLLINQQLKTLTLWTY